jgi:hypothetical protein
MPSTYTVNLGIEKPATGEQSGTWGDTTNVNFDIVDQAINGVLSLTLASAGTSGSPNTLTIDNGATSDGRNKWIEFVDGGDLGANAYVQLDPNDAEKIVFFRNSLSGSRSVFVFQGTYNAANDFEIPAGYDVVLKFDGGGASATVTDVFQKLRVTELYTPTLGAGTADINDGTVEAVIGGTTPKAGTFTTLTANTNLTVNASTTVDGIIDDDTMATASATKLSTSESIKAYVDSQVGTVDTLSEILANGNTSGANNLIIDNGQAITTNTVNETTAGSGVTVDSVLLKDDGINATNLEITNIKANDGTAAGSIANSTGAVTITSFISNSVDIGGGAIDGTTIGGTTPNSGAFTTLSATGDLTVDTNTLYVDSTNNRIGVGTSSPAAKLHVTSASSGVTPNTTGDELFVEGSGDSGITIGSGTASQGRLFFGDSGFATAGRVGYNHADNSLYFGTNGVAERMRIDSSGNVGIGTASPLSAAGYSWLTINGASSGGVVSLSNAGTELGRLQSNILATTLSTLTVAPLVFKTNNAEWMRISSAGLVGIGTSSPSAKLTVNGDSEINSLTIGRGAGNNNTNTVFGNSAFGNNTTGVNNTAVGYQSLYSNTTGSQNTTTGREALRNNTTGANNIAVGGSALYSNTTGGSNTATGFRSLYSNTTGANNTATGNQSLYSNTTGANNDSAISRSNNTTGGGNTATGNQSLYSRRLQSLSRSIATLLERTILPSAFSRSIATLPAPKTMPLAAKRSITTLLATIMIPSAISRSIATLPATTILRAILPSGCSRSIATLLARAILPSAFSRSIATLRATLILPLAAKRFVTTLLASLMFPLAISRSITTLPAATILPLALRQGILLQRAVAMSSSVRGLIHRRKTELIKSSSVTL